MVHVATAQVNPSWCHQPAAYKTRCPECGKPSAWGLVCRPCLDTMFPPIRRSVPVAPPVPDVQPADTGTLLELSTDADGLVDVALYVGPDNADGDEVLTPEEYLRYLKHCVVHLQSYAAGYEAAMVAES